MTRSLVVIAAALAGTACALSGLPDEELPHSPIAIVNRTPEDSRQRAEALADQEKELAAQRGLPPPTSASGDPTVPRVKDVQKYLKSVMSPEQQKEIERRFPGRLALLDPRTQKVEPLAAAWGDAVPKAWSADHSKLLFAALVDDFAQLFEFDVGKGEVRPITRGPEAHPSGCHGPDGSYVLMTVGVANDQLFSRLEILEPGSTNPRPLTAGPRDHSPTCAPDGSVVVYVADVSRGVHWVMARELRGEHEPRRLGPGSEPQFCGGSEWIVYTAPVQRGTKIARMRADGTGRARVGSGVLDETAPTCSPDGRLVAYNVVEGKTEILYVKRFDGSGDRILFNDSSATKPVW